MVQSPFLIGVIILIALGPALGNWDQKWSRILHAGTIAGTSVILAFLKGSEYLIHFHLIETIPSIAMVLGIIPLAVFRFSVTPKSQVALFLYLGFLVPIASNIASSLVVLGMVIAVWSYMYKVYGLARAILISMIVIMFCSNFLATFTYQADLPTTKYGSDLLAMIDYTEGKHPFEILRPVGFISWVVYIFLLFSLGVSTRGKVGYMIDGLSGFVASVVTCLIFIFAMKSGVWVAYLASPFIGYAMARFIDKEWKKHHGTVSVLTENVLETVLLFGAIFGLISLMPLEEVAKESASLIPAITAILTLFTDNLIAYTATVGPGFEPGWEYGVRFCLLVSIMFGGHFVLGHAALIVFFLNFMPKEWQRIKDHRVVEEQAGRDVQITNKNYLKFMLRMNLLCSVCFLPMTLTLVFGAGNNYLLALGFFLGALGVKLLYFFSKKLYPLKKSR